jgi:polyhydroxybutyrate depolymerase
MMRLTKYRFNVLADQYGILVAYPDGIRRGWNDGRGGRRALAGREQVDDAGFLDTLVKTLETRLPVDPGRIAVAGISNGGMMALRMGCDPHLKVRLVCSVAASMPVDDLPLLHAVRGVSLALFDGTDDPIVPFHGGEVRVLWQNRGTVVGADSTIALWRAENSCAAHARLRTIQAPDGETPVSVTEYGDCTEGVRIVEYRIEGGGHTWPGGTQYLPRWIVGRTTEAINACDEIVRLLEELR